MKWYYFVAASCLLSGCSASVSEEKLVADQQDVEKNDSSVLPESKHPLNGRALGQPEEKKSISARKKGELVLPYIQKNVCPFEGCKYRKIWKANSVTDVYKDEDKTELLFTLKKGESFKALKGNVHIIKPGELVITESFGDFTKGEEIAVLSYQGEGGYDLWYKGKVIDKYISELWSLVPPKGILKSKPQTEWWIHIVTERGKFGWIQGDGKIDFD